MLRLLLINPKSKYKGLGDYGTTSYPLLNLPYVAALTPDHYQIVVIDENIKPFEFQEADIVGITAFTSTVNRAYEIAQIYRKKGIPTVMGGIHVSMLPEEALNYCDAVVIGEAEGAWPRLLEDFEAGGLKKQYRGSWIDLAHLPLPRRDILQNEYYNWGGIQTSRGCPMNCAFCSVTAFNGRRFRRRPVEAVIDELEQIPQKKVMITDDNIIGYSKEDSDWARIFFLRIIEKKIKKIFFVQGSIQFGEDRELIRLAAKAGVKILFIGLESVKPETLRAYQKGLNLKRLQKNKYHKLISRIRKAGIAVIGAFVVGGDDEDTSIFQKTLDFIQSSHIDILQITKPTPLPGTQLWHKLSSEGRIINQNFPEAWEDYRLTKMVYKPTKMSIEDVYEGFTYLREIYYGFWQTLKRTMNTLLTTKNPVTTIVAYKFNASFRMGYIDSEHRKIYNRSGLKRKFNPIDQVQRRP
jgi:radical SAM superfamily enzyme YgiQ (UPF0313 family)